MSGGGFVGEIFSRYAATFLFTYDIVLTLDEEMTLVWRSAWSVPKGIYYFIRYFGLAASIFSCAISTQSRSPDFCFKYNWFNSTWLLVAAGLADFLLLLRILAILGTIRPRTSRALKWIYGVTYSAEFALLVYSLCSSTEALNSTSYVDNLGCITTDLYYSQTSINLGNLSIPIAACLVLILNLAFLVVVVSHLAQFWLNAKDTQPPLVICLLRDGLASFLILTVTASFCIITPLVFFNRPGLELMSLPWFLALSPMASCMIFRNLRQVARKPSQGEEVVDESSWGSFALKTLPYDGVRRVASESNNPSALPGNNLPDASAQV